ncbi:MAG TPA: hypothetical protein VKB81_19855 [Nitrospira sp.]|nr:hypothetical protein [Nitrospira sp.]
MWNKHTILQIGFALVLSLIPLERSLASEDSKVSEFLHRYDVLKAHATRLLDSSRQARLEGQVTNDRKPLLYLRKVVMEFCFEVRKYLHVQRTGGAINSVASDAHGHVVAIAYCCETMEQVLETEFDGYQAGGQNAALLQIQGKYEVARKVADSFVTREGNRGGTSYEIHCW